MLKISNDHLRLRYSIGDKSRRYVDNVKQDWMELYTRLSRSDADTLTLAEFKSKSKDWQAARKNNGFFVGGTFKGGVRHKVNARPRQLIVLDIDQGTPAVLKSLQDGTTGIGDIEYVVYSTRTHGDGEIKLRMVIPMEKSLPDERFEPLSRILAELLDPEMKMVDPVSFRPSQFMYWPSHCADIEPVYIHNRGDLLDPGAVLRRWSDAWGDWSDFRNLPRSPRDDARVRADVARSADPLKKRGHVGAFCNEWDIHDAILAFDLPYSPTEVDNNGVPTRYTYIHGSMTNGMVVYDNGHKAHSFHSSDPLGDTNFNSYDMTRIHLFGHLDGAREEGDDPRQMPSYKALVRLLMDKPEFMARLRDSYYGLSPEDVDDSLDTVENAPEVTSQEFDPEQKENTSGDWKDGLELNEKGTIRPSMHNLTLILGNAATFRGRFGFNEFTMRECLTARLRSKALKLDFPVPAGEDFIPVEDVHIHTIRRILDAPRGANKTGWGLRVGENDVRAAVRMVCEDNPFHPPRDHLDGLKWDGVKRLDTLWIRLCHTPDTPYHRMTARNFLIASVARLYAPGTKFDFLPVLIGKTGIRKSTAVRVFGTRAWSTVSEGHYDNKQKFVEASLGFWFIEHAEMQHFRRASDEEGIKAMLSGTVDRVRLAYRHHEGTFKRQFVIVGTTEDTQFLRSYHRRIWPIQCGDAPLDIDWLVANRDQLFAEAVVAYRELVSSGHDPLELPLDLRGEAVREFDTRQADHLLPDEVTDKSGVVDEFLDEDVPERMAKPGWRADAATDADDALSDDKGVQVQRTITCGYEIWVRALGNDEAKYDRRAALLVGDIMRKLAPKWLPGPLGRCGKWGAQRTFRRQKVIKGK